MNYDEFRYKLHLNDNTDGIACCEFDITEMELGQLGKFVSVPVKTDVDKSN